MYSYSVIKTKSGLNDGQRSKEMSLVFSDINNSVNRKYEINSQIKCTHYTITV